MYSHDLHAGHQATGQGGKHINLRGRLGEKIVAQNRGSGRQAAYLGLTG
jgi:hypothetical protein